MVRPPLILLGVALCTMLAAPTSAQMGYTLYSIDWLVVDADVVVRGRIIEFTAEPAEDKKGPYAWVNITLQVAETFKGQKVERLTFADRSVGTDQRYEQWKEASTEHLWLLADRTRDRVGRLRDVRRASSGHALVPLGLASGSWSKIRLGPPVAGERGYVPQPEKFYTARFELLRTPEEILKAVRVAAGVERPEGRIASHTITISRMLAQRTGRSGDANQFVVPRDERLERLARQMIQAPGQLLPPLAEYGAKPLNGPDLRATWRQSDLDGLRREGACALAYFKSDENVALLGGMLNDPAHWSRRIEQGLGAGHQERVYYVREAAWATLRQWDVLLESPVLRELVPEGD